MVRKGIDPRELRSRRGGTGTQGVGLDGTQERRRGHPAASAVGSLGAADWFAHIENLTELSGSVGDGR